MSYYLFIVSLHLPLSSSPFVITGPPPPPLLLSLTPLHNLPCVTLVSSLFASEVFFGNLPRFFSGARSSEEQYCLPCCLRASHSTFYLLWRVDGHSYGTLVFPFLLSSLFPPLSFPHPTPPPTKMFFYDRAIRPVFL